MKSKFLILILGLALVGCGTKTQEIVVDGAPGAPGQDGISMGIDVVSTAPSCLAGGSTIKTFVDSNRNGDLDTDEVIKKVAVICNGVNGTNGTNGIDGTSVSVATASSSQCPTGGVVFTAGLISTAICNGAQGDMGPAGTNGLNGAAGPQGIPGKSAYEIWLDAGNTGDENDFQSEQQFHFAVTGMASYSSYTLEVTFNNGSVVNQVQDSNGGASTYVNPLYTIAPQNLANGFDFYAKHNGNVVNKPTVASAKVKKNGQEMTCTVSN